VRARDVLIVGGGPAGLIAARELAAIAPQLDVLLVERDRAFGAPVRCGEGVGHDGLAEFVDPTDAPWISQRIGRVVLRAPNGADVRIAGKDVGYILDRTRFEPALAASAAAAGAELRLGSEVTGMRPAANTGWRVSLAGPAGDSEVDVRLVIGADGVESLVGRWAGLDTRVPSRDMESCAQYVVANIDFDPDAICLHFGSRIAPGGYAWVFPKSTTEANVGLGVVALRGEGRSARQWLDRYITEYFPTATILGATVGGVIVHPTVSRTVADGVMLCGDAAHMVNPLSGGGIVNAMKAGRLAAQVAARALAVDDTSASRLQQYHAEWMALLGDDHVRFYRIKQALEKFDDAFFDSLATMANSIAEERRTLRRIFAHALVRHPTLLPVVAKYFKGA